MIGQVLAEIDYVTFLRSYQILIITLLVVEVTWLLPNLANFWSDQLDHSWFALKHAPLELRERNTRRCRLFFRWYKINIASIAIMLSIEMVALVGLAVYWVIWHDVTFGWSIVVGFIVIVVGAVVPSFASLMGLVKSKPVMSKIDVLKRDPAYPRTSPGLRRSTMGCGAVALMIYRGVRRFLRRLRRNI